MNRKVIGSNQLARELVQQGFKVVDIAPHRNDSRRSIFVFELTPELEQYLLNQRM